MEHFLDLFISLFLVLATDKAGGIKGCNACLNKLWTKDICDILNQLFIALCLVTVLVLRKEGRRGASHRYLRLCREKNVCTNFIVVLISACCAWSQYVFASCFSDRIGPLRLHSISTHLYLKFWWYGSGCQEMLSIS